MDSPGRRFLFVLFSETKRIFLVMQTTATSYAAPVEMVATSRPELQSIAALVRHHEAHETLTDLITYCYAAGVFAKKGQAFGNRNGQAFEMVEMVVDCASVGASLFCNVEFPEPAEPDGLQYKHYRHLDAVDLAALLCMVVCYLIRRRFIGPTQIKLLTRDCEQSIAHGWTDCQTASMSRERLF